jgi:serine protease Do
MPDVSKRALTAALLVLAAACTSSERGVAQDRNQQTPPAIREQLGDVSQQLETRTAEALSSTFRTASSRALPAVVFIQVVRPGTEVQDIPEPFRRFFPMPPDGEEQPVPGAGSGFILDDQGHVITNHHVVDEAQQVIVRLVDGREFSAEVLGSDDQTDVAVLKINPNGAQLPHADLGNSDQLQVGDWVLALGSPLELEFTVTAGIVSAKGRQLPGPASALQAFIQTDAAINPGNSGGPLVDLAGRVVGINSAIFGGQRFVGYGFAIPINLANKVVQDILRFGEVRRPMLGVQVQDVNEADAEVYQLPEIRGAEVVSVSAGSAAEQAGLRLGDVILALDGDEVGDATDLTTGLAQHQPGDRVRLTVWRERASRELTVELGAFERAADRPATPEQRHEVEQALGFRVEPLDEATARELEFDVTRGVVVSQVAPLSSAANSGVRPGMLLLAINREAVATVADVERLAREIEPGDVVSLRVRAPQIGELMINYRARR